MKLTKSGEIEACCEWSGEIRQYYVKPFCTPRHAFAGSWDNRVKLEMDCFPNFCPNCGAKTEIEGEER